MHNFSNKKLGNRYTLLEKVGDGGMALVYKAKCELLNRNVAVKVLRPEFMADEDFLKKFKSESQAVASLSHPNIVNVYDVGNEEGISYIVMEYVEGINLKDYIKKHGSVDYKEALTIIKQIAKALEHAHKNGVIHRDIKPHNILITDEGIVKVADFGIARATTSSTMTNTKTVMGSVHYVSPEQAKGSFVDNKTDIYSLGIVMYELLTGEVPFTGDSPISVAIKHIQEEIKRPSEINQSIPEGVSDIVIKATEKDPLNRYQTLTEMIKDINTIESSPNSRIGLAEDYDEGTRVIPIEEIEKAMNNRTMKINPNDYKNAVKEEEIPEDDDDDFDEYEIQRKEKLKQKTKSKGIKKFKALKTLSMIVVAILVFTGVGFAMWMKTDTKEVTIPTEIVGLKEADAKKALEALNLVVVIQKSKNDAETGTVYDSNPKSGMKVKEKSTITLFVSEKEETPKMPNLEGLTLDEAKEELESVGLEIGNTTKKYSDSVDKGKIISQSVKPDEEFTEGDKIDVVVSKGPEPKEEVKYTSVPSLVGNSLTDAKAALKAAGLKVGSIKYGSDEAYPDGAVIEQETGAGSSVKEGSYVNILVNKLETDNKPDDGDKDKNEDGNGNNNNTGNSNNNNNGNSNGNNNNTGNGNSGNNSGGNTGNSSKPGSDNSGTTNGNASNNNTTH